MSDRRGPKPKPPSDCLSCGLLSVLTRGHCRKCYVRLLRSGHLPKITKSSVPSFLSKAQFEVFTGSMLGDGCLYRHKITHKPYYATQRTLLDRAYAEWQQDLFKDFALPLKTGSTFDERTGKNYQWAKFQTRRSDVFSSEYERWYGTGDKQVPQDIELSQNALAIWLADDGYVRSVGSDWRLQIKLSTHGFSLESAELLCDMLSKRYDEYFGITLEGHEKKPILYAGDSAARLFLTDIDSVFPTSMARKAYWRRPEVCFYENHPQKARPSTWLRRTSHGLRCQKSQVSEDVQSSLVG